jgi:hypothetical protein
MRKCWAAALALLGGSGALLCSAASSAQALDAQLACTTSAHAFIASLRQAHAIDAQPMRVEANSVNAFRPAHGSHLSAFGYRVYAVLGYAPDDDLFRQGSGAAMSGSLYGVVVFGPSEDVGAHLRDAGSGALVHEVVPLLMTAVLCKTR